MPLKEVLADIARWQAGGQTAAMARVVDVIGSSPREPGAAMAVSAGGEVAGSVSGGCVEGAVVEAALEILGGEREPGVISFGYSDEDAFAVGLTCGGTIRLFVEPVAEPVDSGALYVALQQAIDAAQPVALVTVVEGPGIGSKMLVREQGDPLGTLGNADVDRVVARDARGELEAGLSSVRHYGEHGEAREDTMSVFIESFVVPPRMIIFGAVDFTAALASVAKLLGFHVVVCDARDPVALRDAVAGAGGPADLTIVCVDVPGCEGGAILSTADGGTVIFFSMATSFSAAALGAEGLAADVTMLVGNGYVPGHADLAVGLLREHAGIRRLFERRLAGSGHGAGDPDAATMTP